jgi:hypothetical protein
MMEVSSGSNLSASHYPSIRLPTPSCTLASSAGWTQLQQSPTSDFLCSVHSINSTSYIIPIGSTLFYHTAGSLSLFHTHHTRSPMIVQTINSLSHYESAVIWISITLITSGFRVQSDNLNSLPLFQNIYYE